MDFRPFSWRFLLFGYKSLQKKGFGYAFYDPSIYYPNEYCGISPNSCFDTKEEAVAYSKECLEKLILDTTQALNKLNNLINGKD